jgi:hypothetical protein
MITYATIAWIVNWTGGLAKNPAIVSPTWSKISRADSSGDDHAVVRSGDDVRRSVAGTFSASSRPS